jgi:hypothetical protein
MKSRLMEKVELNNSTKNMDNSEIKSRYELLISSVVIIFCAFLVTLIIFFVVAIQNGIKAGHFLGKETGSRDTITVSGAGDVYAKPDVAQMSFSVVSEAKTVAQAMTDNTGKMNAVIDFVKSQGVEDKDMTTTSFNISPVYEYNQASCVSLPCPPERRVLTGYEVNQSLQVKIRVLDKIGAIIEGATAAGANQTGDLQFTIDNPESLVDQARAQAIVKTKSRASEIANRLNVKLVRITDYNEGSSNPVPAYAMYDKEMASGSGSIPDIQAGQNKVEVSVSITYEIE